MAGINANGEWLELFGTQEANQNVWLEINGKPKSVKVYNGEGNLLSKAKADVVFLVDNSGSMDEEANKVAEEIIRWSEKLALTMDVQFGCVGIDHYKINGALNITDSLYGVQVGVVNITGHLHGLQLGVLNISSNGGALVFPILNFGF